jgi:tRNA(adenine34) deaminase
VSDYERFMQEALIEAEKGLAEGEVPIGAVAVKDGEIIARGHNRRNGMTDITRHAEMECLHDLTKHLNGNLDLSDIIIFSTLEPCAMCSGAMIHYGIKTVVYGEVDLVNGAAGSKYDFLKQANVDIIAGVMRDRCRKILLQFFEKELGKKSFVWKDIELPVS